MRPSLLVVLLLSCQPTPEDTGKAPDSGTATDADGDGFTEANGECDDGDSNVNPAALEVCDGRDNDCNGSVDDGLGSTFYEDVDGDGFGDPATASLACEGVGVANGDDCDDADATINPAAIEVCDGDDDDCDGVPDDGVTTQFWVDGDGDGYGDPSVPQPACGPTDGLVADDSDCDDSSAEANPSRLEVCDLQDNDCNGLVDDGVTTTYYPDRDGDGYGGSDPSEDACSQPTGYAALDGDCDDDDTAYNPGAAETDCNDSHDYNCDGSTGYADVDGDGWAACEECDDSLPDVNPDGTEVCNALDDDCDGGVDEADADGAGTWYLDADADGYGTATDSEIACDAPADHVANPDDCDDAETTVNPSALEMCDSIDNDCDAEIDESDAVDALVWYLDYDSDGYGTTRFSTTACDAPADYVASTTDCDDTERDVHPGATEVCDSVDNDCDGTVDDLTDGDGDGFAACDDCDDGDSTTYPGAIEWCNGRDDDCDGTTDEADAADASTWYIDYDSDGYGSTRFSETACDAPAYYVANADDCDDTDADVSPVGIEVCNGLDDDCDGSIDGGTASGSTWYEDDDGDGYGDASSTSVACDAPSGFVADDTDCDDADSTINPAASEECNSVDDDCDGSVDESSTTGLTWYVDSDGDGYGSSTTTTAYTCSAPAGSSAIDGDCDDTDAAISPADTEVCNGEDDDCDGSVDSASACGCSVATYSGNGHTYMFCTTGSYWAAASSSCSAVGYHLATMADAAENSWVTGQANTYITGSDPWIGFNDLASEGSWVWATGEAVTYTNWGSGEPNNSGNEDCAHLYDSGVWNDHQCSGLSTGYICESG
ncbi:hypothetical protein LBMAG42_50980 [Deltaproteobacteria bacterium]|nr:hypothetical protein LBMAG42_50980 [Deltaproteobacteria bacterium]